MKKYFTALLAAAGISTGFLMMPTAAMATNVFHYYADNGSINFQFSEDPGNATFEIWHDDTFGWHEVGNGSVTADGGGVYTLTVCDDKADGIGPYIDRDGGSYGTNGSGTCSTYVAEPYEWRTRWDGYSAPWLGMP